MEYMASGTPLMAYDLPCIPEEYRPYFFEIKGDLHQVLSQLLSQDRRDLHLFGLEAQRWITANKNPKKQTEKVKKLMEQLER